jgi:hypothetical protein
MIKRKTKLNPTVENNRYWQYPMWILKYIVDKYRIGLKREE